MEGLARFDTYYCSTLDSIFPPVVQNWVLCFPCDGSKIQHVANVLRAGFEKTLKQRPYLAGRLSREDAGSYTGRLKLECTESEEVGTRFSVNDLRDKPGIWRSSYEELRQQGMPIGQLDPAILVPPGGYQKLGSSPMVAQANLIPGGCLLDICLNHSFMDGLGGAMAVGAWAQNCKDIQLQINQGNSVDAPDQPSLPDDTKVEEPLELPEILQDRVAPQGKAVTRIQGKGELWKLLGLQQPPTDRIAAWGSPSNKTMVSAIFAASAESIRRLKANALPPDSVNKEPGAPAFVSSFDAMAALLWRCIVRARSKDFGDLTNLSSRLRIPVNVRQVLSIPSNYHGNVLLNSLTEMKVESLIADSGSQHVAPKIRSSLLRCRNKDTALEAIQLSFVLPDIASRRPLFSDTTAQDVVLTSWLDLPYYKQDWGSMFGSPGCAEFFRLPHGYLRGVCALHPRRVDDMVEVVVNLEQSQMDRLKGDEIFTECFAFKTM